MNKVDVRWWAPDAVGKRLEVLHDGGQVELVPCPGEAPQAHALEAVMGLQVSKAHLDLVPSENAIRHLIRAARENRGIIRCDDCHPARVQNIRLRSAQVEAPAAGRESVSAPSTQYSIAAGTASTSLARQRPGLAGLDDSNLSRAARFGSGGEVGDNPAVASCGFQGFLAPEISE